MGKKPEKLSFDYGCKRCGFIDNNKNMDSMVCECGGAFTLLTNFNVETFKPYFNESYNKQINTISEHRAFVKKYGAPLGDYQGLREHSKFIRKNREEIISERYAKDYNLKYPKGKQVLYDEKNMRFVPRH